MVTRIERLKKILGDLDEDIRQKNEIISRSEAEIVKRNAIIERKQGVIDQYNKKLELMISQAGVSLFCCYYYFHKFLSILRKTFYNLCGQNIIIDRYVGEFTSFNETCNLPFL